MWGAIFFLIQIGKICPLVKKLTSTLERINKRFWLGVILVKTSSFRNPWAIKCKFCCCLFVDVSCNRKLTNLTLINEMQVLLKDDNFSLNPASFHYLICIGLQSPPLPKTVCPELQFTESIHNLYNLYTISIS